MDCGVGEFFEYKLQIVHESFGSYRGAIDSLFQVPGIKFGLSERYKSTGVEYKIWNRE